MTKIMIEDPENSGIDYLELEENQMRLLKWLDDNGYLYENIIVTKVDEIQYARI